MEESMNRTNAILNPRGWPGKSKKEKERTFSCVLLASFLVEHGYTLKGFADKTGISKAAMGDYKKGTTKPTKDALKKIADGFGLIPDDFMVEVDYE